MDFTRLFLSTEGRIGRLEFWIGMLSVAVAIVILTVIIAVTLTPESFTAHLLVFVCEIVAAYPVYCVMAKRFQDRGRPGIYAAAGVGVPLLIALLSILGLTGTETESTLLGQILGYLDIVVGLWILIDLGIMPGTTGPNAFGRDPVAS